MLNSVGENAQKINYIFIIIIIILKENWMFPRIVHGRHIGLVSKIETSERLQVREQEQWSASSGFESKLYLYYTDLYELILKNKIVKILQQSFIC